MTQNEETVVAVYDRPLTAPVQTTSNIRGVLMANEAELLKHLAVGCGVTIQQIISTAITAVTTADAKALAGLHRCTGKSFLVSVAEAARYGLVFGKVLGQAYLIPRGGLCCLDVGYRGYEALIYRHGGVKVIQSGIVYAGDEYDVLIGRQPDPIRHKPNPTASHDDKNIVAAYTVVWVSTGLAVAEHMNRADLDHIRAKSPMGSKGAYVTDLAEMFRKAPIRRIAKHLPLSPSDRMLMDEILSTEDDRNGVHAPAGDTVIEGEARARDLLKGLEGAAPSDAAEPTAAQGRVMDLCIAQADGEGADWSEILRAATVRVFGGARVLGSLSNAECEKVLTRGQEKP